MVFGDGTTRISGSTIARIALYVIASWLIAAHFLRRGDLILTGLCVATPALFFLRHRLSLFVLQGLAYVATAIWLETAWHIIATRRLFGEPWLLSTVILGTVATVTMLAGLLLNSGHLRVCYWNDE